ncbi:MAG: hypothetical protein JSS40_16940 [Proteobacteria bacterium]|nr:hypothetical protein [Pseudomonadota bacterium]
MVEELPPLLGDMPPGLVDAAGTADAVPGALSIPVVLLAGVAAAVPGALSTPVAFTWLLGVPGALSIPAVADVSPGPPPGVERPVGTCPAQLGTAARAPMAADERARTSSWACSFIAWISASTSMLKNSRSGRALSSILMMASADSTTPAMLNSMEPNVVAQASRQADDCSTCAETIATLTQ